MRDFSDRYTTWRREITFDLVLGDDTVVKSEFVFNHVKDVTFYCSEEFTGAFVREYKGDYIPVGERVGRFPYRSNGGPSWYGLLTDWSIKNWSEE